MSMLKLNNTPFCNRLGIAWPLIQAPLSGGPSTPELVAAVCNAGALGSLGAAYMSANEMVNAIQQIRRLTAKPFAVNLFVPTTIPTFTADQMNAAIKATQKYRDELGLSLPQIPSFTENFSEQLDIVLQYKPAVFSFTFGLMDKQIIKECRQQGIITIGTATTPEEGIALQESGVDAIVAQGVEAGGHRGMFSAEQQDALIGTFALTRLLSETVGIPVIASGGIMDGKGIASALILGAKAAQLGTAFLLCNEAGTSTAYREALMHAPNNTTMLTRAFSGRWARGINNRFMTEMATQNYSILPFPIQNAFTRDIRKKAAELGRSEFLSLWAGQGVKLIRKMDAATLVHHLRQETMDACKTI